MEESEFFCFKKNRGQVAVSNQKCEGKIRSKSFTVLYEKEAPIQINAQVKGKREGGGGVHKEGQLKEKNQINGQSIL